jgi:hypothetical protein
MERKLPIISQKINISFDYRFVENRPTWRKVSEDSPNVIALRNDDDKEKGETVTKSNKNGLMEQSCFKILIERD